MKAAFGLDPLAIASRLLAIARPRLRRASRSVFLESDLTINLVWRRHTILDGPRVIRSRSLVVAQSPTRLVRKAVLLQRRISVTARFPLMGRIAAAHEVSYVLADQVELNIVRLLGILVPHFRQSLCKQNVWVKIWLTFRALMKSGNLNELCLTGWSLVDWEVFLT